MINKHDTRENYCRMLGHVLNFKYCRTMKEGLPCGRILDCWFEVMPIQEFIGQVYRERLKESKIPFGGYLVNRMEMFAESIPIDLATASSCLTGLQAPGLNVHEFEKKLITNLSEVQSRKRSERESIMPLLQSGDSTFAVPELEKPVAELRDLALLAQSLS